MHNLLFCAHTLCMSYVTNTFLLASSSVRSKQLLCFVHGQGQKVNKNITKIFAGFHNHSPLLTMTPCFKPRHACVVKPEVPKSRTLEMDYSRAPCLGADQKTRGLWERDCSLVRYSHSFVFWYVNNLCINTVRAHFPWSNLYLSINKRLSEISYDETSFNKAAPLYQKALDASGYKHCLKFSTPSASQPSNPDRKNRHRNIIWYNPPFSKNVATNLGKSFLKILDEEFPKEHVLHKIFHRNAVKITYSCMSNI